MLRPGRNDVNSVHRIFGVQRASRESRISVDGGTHQVRSVIPFGSGSTRGLIDHQDAALEGSGGHGLSNVIADVLSFSLSRRAPALRTGAGHQRELHEEKFAGQGSANEPAKTATRRADQFSFALDGDVGPCVSYGYFDGGTY